MGVRPTRVNEDPHVILPFGHAMACPYVGRRGDLRGSLRRRGISHGVENTQSEIHRSAQDDSERLGMTVLRRCHTDSKRQESTPVFFHAHKYI
jgi:hypothetical protein